MMKKTEKALEKKTKTVLTKEYAQTLADLKKEVQNAQIKAALSANKELIKLYWTIGKTIVEKQEKNGWGSNIIETLAKDLQDTFPGMAGFSRANIFRMRAFFQAYEKVAQAVRQLDALPIFNIPWGHNIMLFQKLDSPKEQIWYAQKTIDHGWSRNMLELWIKSDLFKREGKAITNFKHTLPAPHSDLAQQSLKDPYLFDFLTLHKEHLEKEIEQGLIDHIQKFLLELGEGFAFVARQKHLEVGGADYYIDLLFYHLKLRCYVVIELKSTAFKPEYTGQINFYLAAVDDLIKHPDDKPTIGLLLCKSKNNITVEYALRGNKSPIGISSYETKIVEKLPKNLKGSLPAVEEIEAELEKQNTLAKEIVKKSKKA
jgi:predicted nuclease of restriction endonuclease-like (RecB) superfamily